MREPKHSCPDIDAAKRCLRTVLDEASNIRRQAEFIDSLEDDDEIVLTRGSIYEIQLSLDEIDRYADLDRELEEIRELNSSLREWGHSLLKQLEEYENA